MFSKSTLTLMFSIFLFVPIVFAEIYISCQRQNIVAGESVTCSIVDCKDVLWIITNNKGIPLSLPLITNDYNVNIKTKGTGEVIINTVCFNPDIGVRSKIINVASELPYNPYAATDSGTEQPYCYQYYLDPKICPCGCDPTSNGGVCKNCTTVTTQNTQNTAFISITTCKSGATDWVCNISGVCKCELAGSCTNGDFLVYKKDPNDILCSFEINGSEVVMYWDKCGSPTTDDVKVVVDCNGNRSSEETIFIIDSNTKTTKPTSTTIFRFGCLYECRSSCEDDTVPPACFSGVSHGAKGCEAGLTCCEYAPKACPLPATIKIKQQCLHECCPESEEYKTKRCDEGSFCCGDNTCKKSCPGSPSNIDMTVPLLIFMVILAPVIIFSLYIIFGRK